MVRTRATRGGIGELEELDSQAAPTDRCLQGEDRVADLADRLVEIVDGLRDPLRHLRLHGDEARGLERDAGGEQSLDHLVVEIAGDAVAVLEHRDLLDPLHEPGLVDGHAGRGRERHCEGLVVVAELGRPPLLAEVQVAEHLAPHPDRHAEERAHRRVVRRKAIRVRVLREIRQPQRLGIDDEQTEDAVSLGQVPDRSVGRRVDADGDELAQVAGRHR